MIRTMHSRIGFNGFGNAKPVENAVPSYVTEFAKAVIAGEWGNGTERKENIYKAIQNEVGRLLSE